MNYVTTPRPKPRRAIHWGRLVATGYLGGSVPGAASSMGKVVAAEGVASAVVETAVSGAVVAALCAAGAGCTADVPARMARSKRRAASASVVMCPAMISAAGAFLPYSLLLDLISIAITLPSTDPTTK